MTVKTYTYSTDGPECPYCGRKYVPDDGCYYDEYNYTEQDCDDCGKKFHVSVNHSTSWTCEPMEPELSAGIINRPVNTA